MFYGCPKAPRWVGRLRAVERERAAERLEPQRGAALPDRGPDPVVADRFGAGRNVALEGGRGGLHHGPGLGRQGEGHRPREALEPAVVGQRREAERGRAGVARKRDGPGEGVRPEVAGVGVHLDLAPAPRDLNRTRVGAGAQRAPDPIRRQVGRVGLELEGPDRSGHGRRCTVGLDVEGGRTGNLEGVVRGRAVDRPPVEQAEEALGVLDLVVVGLDLEPVARGVEPDARPVHGGLVALDADLHAGGGAVDGADVDAALVRTEGYVGRARQLEGAGYRP